MIKALCIVVPIYNDWASMRVLLERLNAVAGTLETQFFIIAVDDGSTEEEQGQLGEVGRLTSLRGVEVVHLASNVGHQRAIAIGLCLAVERHGADAVLVMDGDGEDPPESIATLLDRAAGLKDVCIVAQRRKRTEKRFPGIKS